MALPAQILWFSRFVTFAIGAVAAGSGVFWALKFSGVANTKPSVSVDSKPPVVANTIAVARALGGVDPAAATSSTSALSASRFVLAGVMANPQRAGAALIAVDGKPAKPFMVGATVGSDWVLRSVQPRRAVLSTGSTDMVLDLPALAGALTAPAIKP
jgi:general secretion pathway protein C